MYEVELKFWAADREAVVSRLLEMGAEPRPVLTQSDAYFNHPSRDFGQTDEAFRVRTVGDEAVVTYKGPVVDQRVKARREVEASLKGLADAKALSEVLLALGFRPVRSVDKLRRPFLLTWHGRSVEAVLDVVDGLGDFFEIETLADDADKDLAIESVLQLAAELGLSNPERKSYLCLLLEKNEKKR